MANTTTSKQAVFEIICRHVRDVLPDTVGRELTPAASLRDLGANSMDRADIIMEVMATLALDIPRIELLGARNLGELTDLVHAKL